MAQFPEKLYNILCDPSNHEAISWVNGNSFTVNDRKKLEMEVLPKYFRHAKLTSFQRQLSLYGIKRNNDEAYSHPLLLEDRPELVHQMRRKNNKLKSDSPSAAHGEDMLSDVGSNTPGGTSRLHKLDSVSSGKDAHSIFNSSSVAAAQAHAHAHSALVAESMQMHHTQGGYSESRYSSMTHGSGASADNYSVSGPYRPSMVAQQQQQHIFDGQSDDHKQMMQRHGLMMGSNIGPYFSSGLFGAGSGEKVEPSSSGTTSSSGLYPYSYSSAQDERLVGQKRRARSETEGSWDDSARAAASALQAMQGATASPSLGPTPLGPPLSLGPPDHDDPGLAPVNLKRAHSLAENPLSHTASGEFDASAAERIKW
jgi:hypothetical protein